MTTAPNMDGIVNDDTQSDNATEDTDTAGNTWQPVGLGPYLRGEIKPPKPALGMSRSDGQFMLYPGREHAVIGETESGKSWFAQACIAQQMLLGNPVLYIHYEESEPGSTIERLRLLGVPDHDIERYLTFVGPIEQVRQEWLAALLANRPTIVVHDGINEAMALHCAKQDTEGAHEFRKRLIRPCLAAGAATLACDHLPKANNGSASRDAYGTVGKGNNLDGARFVLVNKAPFGRGKAGRSSVYVTKDRPGYLRVHGQDTATPGVTFMGTLVVDDDQTQGPDPRIEFYAPKAGDAETVGHSQDESGRDDLPESICAVLADQPGRFVGSFRELRTLLRAIGKCGSDRKLKDALDDLEQARRVAKEIGSRNSTGFRLTESTVSDGSADE